jgi:hypothetical protein
MTVPSAEGPSPAGSAGDGQRRAERDTRADARERAANLRDWNADERDLVAARREQIADEREDVADERELLLDSREQWLDEREREVAILVKSHRDAQSLGAEALGLIDDRWSTISVSREERQGEQDGLERARAWSERRDSRRCREQAAVHREMRATERTIDLEVDGESDTNAGA